LVPKEKKEVRHEQKKDFWKIFKMSSRPPPPAGRAGNRRDAGSSRKDEGGFVAANFSSP